MKSHILIFFMLFAALAGQATAMEFDHAEHLTYIPDTTCDACHLPEAQAIVPDLTVCLDCHEQEHVDAVNLPGLKTHGLTWSLVHGTAARGEAYDCSACHEQADCLDCHTAGFADEMGEFNNHMLNVHRSDFQVTHPIAARTDQQLCRSCHEVRFCDECHDSFAPDDLALLSHRKGWSNLVISPSGPAHSQFDESTCATCHPNSVLPTHQWSGSHAREARKNLATCQSCHPQGDVCLTCHSARSGLRVNPHPADWDDMKGRLERAGGRKTCNRCH